MERKAGVCYCKLDGQMLDLEGTISISPAMNVREAIVGSTGVIGYRETPRAPTVEVTAYPDSRAMIQKLLNATGMTVTCEMANEKLVYVLSEAFVSGEPTFDGDAGTASITFTGVRGEWV